MAFVTMLLEDTPLWLLGLFLFVIFWLAAAFGRWLRSKTTQTGDKSDPALIASASLGLLALRRRLGATLLRRALHGGAGRATEARTEVPTGGLLAGSPLAGLRAGVVGAQARADDPRLHAPGSDDGLRATCEHEATCLFGAEIPHHSDTGVERCFDADDGRTGVAVRAGDKPDHAARVLVVVGPRHRPQERHVVGSDPHDGGRRLGEVEPDVDDGEHTALPVPVVVVTAVDDLRRVQTLIPLIGEPREVDGEGVPAASCSVQRRAGAIGEHSGEPGEVGTGAESRGVAGVPGFGVGLGHAVLHPGMSG